MVCALPGKPEQFKRNYQGVKHKAFKILMLNLDDDEQAWTQESKTIDQDWIFLNESKKFSESKWAEKFGISAIPKYLIVDKASSSIMT